MKIQNRIAFALVSCAVAALPQPVRQLIRKKRSAGSCPTIRAAGSGLHRAPFAALTSRSRSCSPQRSRRECPAAPAAQSVRVK